MKIVEPYISIMSPGRSTPTLTASAAASMAPAVTGVPGASPVSAAACVVISPTISVVQWRVGNWSIEAISAVSASDQSRRSMS